MKKLFIATLLLLFSSQLYAKSLTLSEFRKMHRNMLLSEFKTLYKERHIGSHKAQLRAKYRRIKRVSHTKLYHKSHHMKSNDERGDTVQMSMDEASYTLMKHTSNANMQMQANSNLEAMKAHKEEGMPKKPFDNMVDDYLQPQGDMTDNHPQQNEDTKPYISKEDANIESQPQVNMPSGYDETPSITQPKEPQSGDNDMMQEGNEQSGEGELLPESSEDNSYSDDIKGGTMSSDKEGSRVRPLYANPWRRR